MEVKENQSIVLYDIHNVDQVDSRYSVIPVFQLSVKVNISNKELTVNLHSIEDLRNDFIIVNIENKLIFSLKLVKEDFSIWNKTEAHMEELPESPWIDLIDFPLQSSSSGDDSMHSSGQDQRFLPFLHIRLSLC